RQEKAAYSGCNVRLPSEAGQWQFGPERLGILALFLAPEKLVQSLPSLAGAVIRRLGLAQQIVELLLCGALARSRAALEQARELCPRVGFPPAAALHERRCRVREVLAEVPARFLHNRIGFRLAARIVEARVVVPAVDAAAQI